MELIRQTWQGVRSHGLIMVSVPEQQWTRTCHQWSVWQMRLYVRAAVEIPADIRLEIYRWLEQQEAAVEAEIATTDQRIAARAEMFFWVCFGFSLLVVIGGLAIAIGG